MLAIFKYYLDKCFETCLAFFQEKNPLGSSKRLTIIASYFSAIAVCWFSLTTGVPIDSSVLSLVIFLVTTSTGNYLISKKGEPKKDVTPDAKEEAKDGQG